MDSREMFGEIRYLTSLECASIGLEFSRAFVLLSTGRETRGLGLVSRHVTVCLHIRQRKDQGEIWVHISSIIASPTKCRR